MSEAFRDVSMISSAFVCFSFDPFTNKEDEDLSEIYKFVEKKRSLVDRNQSIRCFDFIINKTWFSFESVEAVDDIKNSKLSIRSTPDRENSSSTSSFD